MVRIKQMNGQTLTFALEVIVTVTKSTNSIVLRFKDGSRRQFITGLATDQTYTKIKAQVINYYEDSKC